MWWTHFLCSSRSSRENRIWSPCFLFITAWFSLDTSAEITSWTPLVCLLLCLNEFFSWWKVHRSFIMIINQQIVKYTFSENTCSWATVFILLHMEQQSISYFEHRLFAFIFSYWSSQFLSFLILESSPIY